MLRDITSGVRSELTAGSKRPVFFIEADMRSEMVRLWTGPGASTWKGYTWNGPSGDRGGWSLSIPAITESAAVEATGLKFMMSGLDTRLLGHVLREVQVGRECKLWLGFLDSSNALIADPVETFTGRFDTVEMEESGATCTVEISIESEMMRLQIANRRLWTLEDQRPDFPNDTALRWMASVMNWNGKWGARSIGAITGSTGGIGGGVDRGSRDGGPRFVA